MTCPPTLPILRVKSNIHAPWSKPISLIKGFPNLSLYFTHIPHLIPKSCVEEECIRAASSSSIEFSSQVTTSGCATCVPFHILANHIYAICPKDGSSEDFWLAFDHFTTPRKATVSCIFYLGPFMDQVWRLKKCLMKRSKERTYIALLDISKSYDMLDHDILARTLRKRGAEEAAVGIIAEWYCSMTTVIRMGNSLRNFW
ncbi:hypothetical protein QOT17_012369 [Balamuthia mandrillaris]